MSVRTSYYVIHGTVARNCYTCDRNPCKCDLVEMRRVKRGAKQQIRREIEEATGHQAMVERLEDEIMERLAVAVCTCGWITGRDVCPMCDRPRSMADMAAS